MPPRFASLLSVLILASASVFLSGCSGPLAGCTCPIEAAPHGGPFFWTAPENIEVLHSNRIQRCRVERYADGAPVFGKDMYENFYEQTTENGRKNETLLVSLAEYLKLEGSSNPAPFRREIVDGKTAKNTKAVWVPQYGGDILWMRGKNDYAKLGVAALIDEGSGLSYKPLGTRSMNPNEPLAFDDEQGTVYQMRNGKGVVAGTYAWFWVTPAGGKRLKNVVIMSRGVRPGSKWCGFHDGTVFIEQ